MRGTQEASPDLFHMTPLGRDAEQAGSQPRCTSPAGGKKKNPAAREQNSAAGLSRSCFLPKRRQTKRAIPSRHLGREEQRVTKSQAAADTCYRKRTAAAGREPGGVRRAIELGAQRGPAEPPSRPGSTLDTRRPPPKVSGLQHPKSSPAVGCWEARRGFCCESAAQSPQFGSGARRM